jgi:hypothetical protein
VLDTAAKVAGVDQIVITSGGQPGTHGRSTGSTRHNAGRAADLQLVVNGRTQTFTDSRGGAVCERFVAAAAACGANGIGAGVRYMGNKTFHIGFGTNANDHRKIVWGASGSSANAPGWLRRAAEKGWDDPASIIGDMEDVQSGPGNYVVIARGGLNLRSGPGLSFGVKNVLATGTAVNVIAFDGPEGDWARVDLEGDGLIDGHLFASFLAPISAEPGSLEDVEEPGEEETE